MRVFIIAALTADGFIGRTSEHLSTKWTSQADKRNFVKLTKEAGVMVMGMRTFETIGRALPERRTIVYSQNSDELLKKGVEPTTEPPAELVKRLANEGVQNLAICGGANIYSQFMQAGLVDELFLNIEPVVFGEGLRLFADELDVKLKLLETHEENGTIFNHYKVEL